MGYRRGPLDSGSGVWSSVPSRDAEQHGSDDEGRYREISRQRAETHNRSVHETAKRKSAAREVPRKPLSCARKPRGRWERLRTFVVSGWGCAVAALGLGGLGATVLTYVALVPRVHFSEAGLLDSTILPMRFRCKLTSKTTVASPALPPAPSKRPALDLLGQPSPTDLFGTSYRHRAENTNEPPMNKPLVDLIGPHPPVKDSLTPPPYASDSSKTSPRGHIRVN